MKSTNRLQRSLRITAITALLVTLSVWIGTGSHVGWTRTTITTQQYDEITGISYPVHKAGFIAGIEFLCFGLAAASALGAASYLTYRRTARF